MSQVHPMSAWNPPCRMTAVAPGQGQCGPAGELLFHALGGGGLRGLGLKGLFAAGFQG
jgi:hypothetical protein